MITMKKFFILGLTAISFASVQAQDITDAVRYSLDDLNGTARFRAMGGAFGAVGGDLSALNVNPAGSLFFKNNLLGGSLTDFNTANTANYFGTSTKDSNNKLDINQLGMVFVFNETSNKTGWKKFALGLNYDSSRNLNNSVTFNGTNPYNSVDQYFLSYANGRTINEAVPFGNITNYYFDELYYNEQQAYLGYNAYIIDPLNATANNIDYYTNVAPGGNYFHSYSSNAKGYHSKLTFNLATQYQDWLMLGMNFNFHFVDYRQNTTFFESNSNPKYATGATVDRIRFTNELYTYGNGFSLQLGGIVKVNKSARLGLSYESPTWLKLNDELRQYIATSGYGLNANLDNSQYNTVVVDPQITMVFAPYRFRTPHKLTASGVLLFGKRGLISADVARKYYGGSRFQPRNDYREENATISSALQGATELRLGAEYKIKQVSLRAGYRWDESPYKNKYTVGNLTTFSGGLGYNFGSYKLDVSYSHGFRYYNQQMFNRGLVDYARTKGVYDNVTVSLMWEL